MGTAIGVPQELIRLNMTMAEARERNDEIVAVLDAALANRVVSHRGKYFSFSDVRLLPRTLQQPSPPRWTTVVSAESARRSARRRIKISTGFNSTQVIKRIFDAYREEADAAGFHAGPDYLALRRRVTVAPTRDEARLYARGVTDRLKSFVAEDERLNANVPDAPTPSGGFTLSDDEFITGTPKDVAQNIIEQCQAVGAGNFLTVLNWSAPIESCPSSRAVWPRGYSLVADRALKSRVAPSDPRNTHGLREIIGQFASQQSKTPHVSCGSFASDQRSQRLRRMSAVPPRASKLRLARK
jgi:hypothetical protein